MAEEISIKEMYAEQGREMPKFVIECFCGFQTSKISFYELINHLVDEHNFDRGELEEALDDAVDKVNRHWQSQEKNEI